MLLVSTVVYLLRKSGSTNTRATLLDGVRASLAALKDEEPSLPLHVTATRLSLIIRRYLEAAFKDPALFETNEEFTLRPGALKNIHPDSRKAVVDHLTKLSQLKYAPSNSRESASLIDEAERLVANLEINVTSAGA